MTFTMSSTDQLLQQAIALHQSNRLAQAEVLYRQVLAFRPDLAEIFINCALAQLGQGKREDAVEMLRRAIRAKPDIAKAHYHLGGALSGLGRFGEAVGAYRRAVELQPDHAEAHNNLGNALLCDNDPDAAGLAYERAIVLKPDFARAHNNLGFALMQRGKPADAEKQIRRAIALTPDYAEAHNNLGRALHDQRKHEDANKAFRTAIQLAPGYAEAHANLSSSLYDAGDPVAAESVAIQAVRLDSNSPAAHNALGNAVRHQGRAEESEKHYRDALRIAPNYVEGYKHLAMCLQELGRLDEAFALFDRHAEMSATGREMAARHSPVDPAHKERHDREREAWLAANPAMAQPGARVAGPAVNPANRTAAISEAWRVSDPQIAVVDSLLTPAALESLRQFCLRTSAWQESFERGYLGAVPESGFTPPIIAQIAEEMREVFPDIIGDHPLMYFWGFKYDSELHGIRVHADFAAVNVNFWITPDEANLDPDHGGLVIWNVAAPLEWTFERYNAADAEIRALIEREGGETTTVPYRCNRAAIFDSDLFHETDEISFKAGYENRRINITLLFGRREDGRLIEE